MSQRAVLVFKHLIWKSHPGRLVHVADSPRTFDSTQTTRCKQYFQCLLQLPEILTRTSRLPSDELIVYFKLLLKGVSVEPGLSNKVLLDILAKSKKRSIDALQAVGDAPLEMLEDSDRSFPSFVQLLKLRRCCSFKRSSHRATERSSDRAIERSGDP